ncbi:MAG: hypothetical protein KGQ89_07035 [Verrucomicrobia bacterium]|nr:hypothetical protein [Verrucomicrobiota bacterium]
MSDEHITRSAQVKQGNADDLRMFVSMSPIFPLEESLRNTSEKNLQLSRKRCSFTPGTIPYVNIHPGRKKRIATKKHDEIIRLPAGSRKQKIAVERYFL